MRFRMPYGMSLLSQFRGVFETMGLPETYIPDEARLKSLVQRRLLTAIAGRSVGRSSCAFDQVEGVHMTSQLLENLSQTESFNATFDD